MPEKHFKHEIVKHKRAFDKRSFRTKKKGVHRITFGCPKGKWMPEKKVCKAPVEVQKILHPITENPKKCSIRKNPILETALGVGLGITAGEIGKHALYKTKILKNPKDILAWGAKQLGKTVDELTARDIMNIYYAVEKKKKPFRMTTGEEVLKKKGLRNPMTIGSAYDNKGNYHTIQLTDNRFLLYKNYRYTGKFFTTRKEAERFLNELSKMKNPVKGDYYIGLRKHSSYAEIFTSVSKPVSSRYPKFRRVIGPFGSMNSVAAYMRKHKIIMDNPPGKPIEIYNNILAIEAAKGDSSLWPGEKFRHNFSSKKGRAKVFGMPDGSIVIKGKKKLWKKFDYPERNPRKEMEETHIKINTMLASKKQQGSCQDFYRCPNCKWGYFLEHYRDTSVLIECPYCGNIHAKK